MPIRLIRKEFDPSTIKIVAWITLIFELIQILIIIFFGQKREECFEDDGKFACKLNNIVIKYDYVFCIIGIIVNIILFKGVNQRREIYFLPWLYFHWISLFFHLFNLIATGYIITNNVMFVLGIPIFLFALILIHDQKNALPTENERNNRSTQRQQNQQQNSTREGHTHEIQLESTDNLSPIVNQITNNVNNYQNEFRTEINDFERPQQLRQQQIISEIFAQENDAVLNISQSSDPNQDNPPSYDTVKRLNRLPSYNTAQNYNKNNI